MAEGDNPVSGVIPTEQQISLLRQQIDLLREREARIKESLGLTEDQERAVTAYIAAQKDLNDAIARGNTNLNEYEKRLEDASEKLKDLSDEQANGINKMGELAKQTAIHNAELEVANKRIERNTFLLGKANAAFSAYNSTVATFTGLNLPTTVGEVATSFMQLINGLDTAQTEFAQATGFTSRFKDELFEATREGRRFGMGMDESSRAMAGLNNSMTLFPTLGKGARQVLTSTTVALTKLGISGEESGRTLDILTKGMYESGLGAESALQDFNDLASSVGLPTSQIISDFNDMGPELAKFGNEGKKVFAAMQKQARSLGLTVKDAFNLEQQFETFEGAAGMAGRLNAQLGLRLNSIELMTAKEGERIKIMRQEFKERGLNFKEMDRFQKKAIADILGVDVDMASRILGSEADLALYQAEQESIKDKADKMTTAMDKFKGAFEEFLIKVVGSDRFKGFLDSLTQIAQNLNKDTIEDFGSTLQRWMLIGLGAVTALGASIVSAGASFYLMITNLIKINAQLGQAVRQMERLRAGGVAGVAGGVLPGGIVRSASSPTGYRTPTGQFAPAPKAPATNAPAAPRGGRMPRGAGMAGLLGGMALMGMSSQAKPGSAMSVAGNMASGALMGSMFGPVGALLGALGGVGVSAYQAVTMNAGTVAPRSGGRRNTMAMGQPVSMHEKDQIVYAGRHIFPDAGTRKKENKKMAEEIAKPIVAAVKEVVTAMQNQPPIQLDGKMIAQNTDRRLFTGPRAKYNQFSTSNTLMSS